MKNSNGFHGLRVWERAHALALEIYKVTREFPDEEKYGLTNQIRRSAVSVCANIVEGYRKGRKDFARYLDIANGSLEETKYYLILCRDLGYYQPTVFVNLENLTNEIGRMLGGLIKKLKTYSGPTT